MTGDDAEKLPRFAWLGESRRSLSIVEALARSGLGELVVAAGCNDLAVELLTLAPGVRIEPGWEVLLTRGDVDWLIVAGGAQELLDGARQVAREGTRLLVDLESAPADLLFSELTLLDAEFPGRIRPVFRARNSPLARTLRQLLVAGELGELQQVEFVRQTHETWLSVEGLEKDFLNDADLLASLLGRFEQLTAFRYSDSEGRLRRATTTLGGPGQPPISWNCAPGERMDWKLMIRGARGTAELAGDDSLERLIVDGVERESTPRETAELGALRTLLGNLSAQTPLSTPEDEATGMWDDVLQGLQLQAASRQSLHRRRTVDVLFEAPSERNLFKSHMTAAGCSLLLLTPVGMVLYLMVASAIPMPNWLKTCLVALVFAPVGLFLLMQLLVLITKPAAEHSPVEIGSIPILTTRVSRESRP